MKAVILAAGVGSRIRPLIDKTPKSLLKVGDKTILQRMVDNILDLGIKQIAVVTGYREEQIKDFLSKAYPSMNFTYIRNDLFDKTNTAYSLHLTRLFVGASDFIKFDADVVFEKGVLRKLIGHSGKNCLCIDKNIHLEAEEVKVICDKNGLVLKVGKKLNPKKAHGESIGIEKISKKTAGHLFDELERLLKDIMNYQRYYDDTYTTLVKEGYPFHAVDITGLNWVEIDTHDDYNKAQKIFL